MFPLIVVIFTLFSCLVLKAALTTVRQMSFSGFAVHLLVGHSPLYGHKQSELKCQLLLPCVVASFSNTNFSLIPPRGSGSFYLIVLLDPYKFSLPAARSSLTGSNMTLLTILTVALAGAGAFVSAAPLPDAQVNTTEAFGWSCYPALDFQKPLLMPPNNEHWWCDPSTEYAFVGFSYEVTDCAYFSAKSYGNNMFTWERIDRPERGAVDEGVP